MESPKQWHIIERETSPSTNTELKALAAAGAPAGTVLIARRQTAGRGRLGRSFYSPQGTGLYLSVLLRPNASPEEILQLTPLAAVAAARAVQKACGAEVGIKWVNDLYFKGKKVCGILTESSFDPSVQDAPAVICGLGFNLFPPKDGFPPELASVAGALTEEEDDTLFPRLTAAFLEEFSKALLAPFSVTLEEYRRRSVLTGKTVCSPTESFPGEGLVLGIDDQGGLRLRLEDGKEITLQGGEVSIRVRE